MTDQPAPPLGPMPCPLTKRHISHDEAREIARRFINMHFNNEGEHSRASIPANPERDDDLLLIAYIEQQRTPPAVPASAEPWRIQTEALTELLNASAACMRVIARAGLHPPVTATEGRTPQ